MTSKLPKRKPAPRLETFDYKGQYAYSITICTYNNMPIFNNEQIVKVVFESLLSVCSSEQFGVLAYCFMPNHLHLLLVGGEQSNLIKTLKTFKQISSYRFRMSYKKPLWQRGYYDHILRKEEDLKIVAEYIWGNPVRGGLAESMDDYPFSGPSEYLTNGST